LERSKIRERVQKNARRPYLSSCRTIRIIIAPAAAAAAAAAAAKITTSFTYAGWPLNSRFDSAIRLGKKPS